MNTDCRVMKIVAQSVPCLSYLKEFRYSDFWKMNKDIIPGFLSRFNQSFF